MEQPEYIVLLLNKFAECQERNPRYSLRSYSKRLGIDPGSLSAIIRGRRALSPLRAEQIISRLKLSQAERQKFYLSLLLKQKIPQEILTTQERYYVDEAHNFAILSDWEYAAVLCLISIKSFVPSAKSISAALKISQKRAKIVIANLVTSGFVREKNGDLQLLQNSFTTSEDTLSLALQRSHLIGLKLARTKLLQLDVLERDFSSITIAANSRQMAKMKAMIRNFRREFEANFESHEGDSVVQLNLQLFPLAKNLMRRDKK